MEREWRCIAARARAMGAGIPLHQRLKNYFITLSMRRDRAF